MTILRDNFEKLGLPVGPYTHAVRHESTLHTSGFTAFGTDAQNQEAGAQTAAVLDQLAFIAGQYQKSLRDLIKVTVFATDPADIPGIRDVLSERYGDDVPASSLVMVSGLFAPELKVEIEAQFGL
ncbi:MAG: RidA family protein [Roseibium sp.]|uniref:RidA family protein n=1 Tax=Roseibium sp. TaxID=1936156 RepID=UPI001B2C0BB8|nr:RidA family protein [Roseibium sp.]MBO6893601.1 RidA family protein [Roseibium sp.]MBO6928096.1 RidA family protein [Roseibium sp.]